MSQKSGFLIVSNGFFIENVGHTLTKNYNGTYWPLIQFHTNPTKSLEGQANSNLEFVCYTFLHTLLPNCC